MFGKKKDDQPAPAAAEEYYDPELAELEELERLEKAERLAGGASQDGMAIPPKCPSCGAPIDIHALDADARIIDKCPYCGGALIPE